MFIVAIDPGEATGVAIVSVDLHDHDVDSVLQTYEIAWDDRFSLIPLITDMRKAPLLPNKIVVESFRLYPSEFQHQIGKEFPSVRVIGIIESACYLADMLDRIVLLPAHVKKNVKIRHDLPKSEHIKDAYQLARYQIIMAGRRS
jgi:hypothetical protein